MKRFDEMVLLSFVRKNQTEKQRETKDIDTAKLENTAYDWTDGDCL